jgi:putative heme-binding domain-containing protein
VNGAGGHLGPDLSRIAAIRTRDMLIRSIRDPSASMAVGYRPVTVVTRDGERIRGVTKGEDAFSIQILDAHGRLQGYVKADVQEVIREERSLMRQFGPDRLSDGDLDDLLQYLGTLRGADSDHL